MAKPSNWKRLPEEGCGNTFVDPVQVETALLNLAINARDAMQGRGKLTIEVGNASLDENYATWHVDVMPGSVRHGRCY